MVMCFLGSKLAGTKVGCMDFMEIGLEAVTVGELLVAWIKICMERA